MRLGSFPKVEGEIKIHPGHVTRWTLKISPGNNIDLIPPGNNSKTLNMMEVDNDRGC